MNKESIQYFFITNNNYWSKGASFKKAFDKLKEVNHTQKYECIVVITDDAEATIDYISGGVITHKDTTAIVMAKFKFSQGRLSPVELNNS